MLNKQRAIIKTAWAMALTYRGTVIMFRFSDVLELLAQLVVWTAVFQNSNVVRGYMHNEMITYVIIGYTLHVIARNFLDQAVSTDIERGTLSQFLVKPIRYMSYIITREIGRIGLAVLLSLAAQVAIGAFFYNHLLLPQSVSAAVLIVVMVSLSFIINMFVSFLVGCAGFWMIDTLGLRVSMSVLRRILAGNYFPLDLLPKAFVALSFAAPFAYSFFVPMQLYLGKMSIRQGIIGIGIELVWLAMLYGIIRVVWKRGMRAYESVGI